MNRRYRPMLAKTAEKPFSSKNWIFEVKWDGFRAIAYVNKEVSLLSRNGHELIGNFPELGELGKLTKNVVLDGEIVVIHRGRVNFQALLERGNVISQAEIALQTKRQPASYIVFDILEKDGKPLVDLTLMERKKILARSLKEGNHVFLQEFFDEKGEAYFEAIMDKGLEGMMAKKKDSKYDSGLRTSSWLKIKKIRTCDCVIFGYTEGKGGREGTFGALILGLYDKGKPTYVGKVGTGFTESLLRELMGDFDKLKTKNAPFKPDVSEQITWLKPELVCEVGYQVVTSDRRLRMPRFRRLRTDKQPEECTVDQLADESLKEYAEKRDFTVTNEPQVKDSKAKAHEDNIFVVQEHHARRLHYDFRLEHEGVLKSWAVPKGIPEQSDDKRLAVETEDHPLEYARFAGTIPKGQYGAGEVKIWDRGTFKQKVWTEKMIEVDLKGDKLKGLYVLVPLKRAGEKNWLMLKAKAKP